MAIKINSVNRNAKRKLDLSKLDKAAKITFKELGIKIAEVNIVFVSNQAIRALNRKYLAIDKSTDVIAFIPGTDPIKAKKEKGPFMGDIAISSDKAASNSVEYGTTFVEEVTLYVIHGLLHLAGYKDTDKRSRSIMRKKENEISRKIK